MEGRTFGSVTVEGGKVSYQEIFLVRLTCSENRSWASQCKMLPLPQSLVSLLGDPSLGGTATLELRP